MEPVSAAALTGMLVTYANHLLGIAGESVDDGAKKGLGRLWDRVTARFAGDPAAAGALERLAEQPGNGRRQGAVEDHLGDVLAADPEFANSLTELVAAARADIGNVRIAHAGAVAVGGDVEIHGGIAAGRDVRLGGRTTSVGTGRATSDG